MPILLQPAFILHRRPYRNTSLLLEIFSREHGRLGLVAHGATRSRSRLQGLLQPFTPLLLSWGGSGELGRLHSAEESAPPLLLLRNVALAGLYINELLVRLLPRHDEQPTLFAAYTHLLGALVTTTAEEPLLRCFEKCLLEELGYGLNLEHTADCGEPISAARQYRYVLNYGALPNESATDGIAISGRSLLALRDGQLHDPTLWGEIKQLTRAALREQLQGRSLKSRELYQARSSR